MNVPVEQWGRRLSDTLRDTLNSGDLEAARRLVANGDGQARSLATEFTLMVRGLAITIRVLMGLLGPTLSRLDAGAASAATEDAIGLVQRFGNDIARLAGSASRPQPADLDTAIADASAALEQCQAWFDRSQAAYAQDVVAAIDAGDRARAAAIVEAKENGQYLPLHDRFVRLMAECFGWALRHGGARELERFQLGAAEGQRKGFDKWEQMSAADFAWTTTFLLKQHMGQVTVREDDTKFTIDQAPCGSGGRLRINGAYDGPNALPFVRTPGPLTFGGPEIPVYCSHCPIWNASATLRWFGRAHWVFDNPSRSDGSCTLHIYKRREDTPAEFVRQVTLDPGVTSGAEK